jgi:hypothetical protein
MAKGAYIGPKSPDFLQSKPDLPPAKAVLVPSQAGSTTAKANWVDESGQQLSLSIVNNP